MIFVFSFKEINPLLLQKIFLEISVPELTIELLFTRTIAESLFNEYDSSGIHSNDPPLKISV